MNYYNPYFSMLPTVSAPAQTGLLGGALKGFNFSSILSGTQKVLGIANQAIPLVKQAAPIMKNAKTMFHLMNEFKKVDTPVATTTNRPSVQTDSVVEKTTSVSTDGPTFFI